MESTIYAGTHPRNRALMPSASHVEMLCGNRITAVLNDIARIILSRKCVQEVFNNVYFFS